MYTERTANELTSHHAGDSLYVHQENGNAKRALTIAVCLTLLFAGVEVVGGIMSNSLALISDAGHMVTDSVSLFFAMIASFMARRPASTQYSFGFAKMEIIAAFMNALMMICVVVWICLEAAERFNSPQPVEGGSVFIVATIGLLVNILVAYVLARDDKNINTKAALMHVMGDLLGSVAAIAAGVIIYFGGPVQADPFLSVFVSLLILKSALSVLRRSFKLLIDAVPEDLNYEEVGNSIKETPNIASVHDLHIWDMSADQVALSAHVLVDDITQWPNSLEEIRERLHTNFKINHVTIQAEAADTTV